MPVLLASQCPPSSAIRLAVPAAGRVRVETCKSSANSLLWASYAFHCYTTLLSVLVLCPSIFSISFWIHLERGIQPHSNEVLNLVDFSMGSLVSPRDSPCSKFWNLRSTKHAHKSFLQIYSAGLYLAVGIPQMLLKLLVIASGLRRLSHQA